MANYFSIPQNVVDRIREMHDMYELDKLKKKLENENEAVDIVNKKYGYHEGECIDYDTVVEMIVDVLNLYKK